MLHLDDENMASCNGISSSSPFFPSTFNILQMHPHGSHHEQPHHQLLPCSFHPHQELSRSGMAVSMTGKRSSASAGNGTEVCDGEEELSDDDDCSQPGGAKKRRLNMEQVRTLEKNFELGNKLEPERKMQLARALGLKPRQVAIWFQNRRARWKTKQLEKDYELLKSQFDAIKAENDALHSHNRNLQAEILALKGKESSELINLNKETEGSCSNRSDNSSEINLDISRTMAAVASAAPDKAPADTGPNHSLQNLPFFSAIRQAPTISQFLPITSRPDLHCAKIEHGAVVADENFSNLLCGMDDHNAFWPWPDHHSLH